MRVHRRQPVGSAVFAGCPGSLPPATLTPLSRGPLGSLPHSRCTSTGFRGEAPAVSGRACVASRHRQAPTPRPARTCCVLKSQPRQQRRPARSVMALGVPLAGPCVCPFVCPAAAKSSLRSDTQRRQGPPFATPRRTLAWSHEADLHSGAACGRTLVGLRLAGTLDGPQQGWFPPCSAAASLQVHPTALRRLSFLGDTWDTGGNSGVTSSCKFLRRLWAREPFG